MGMGRRFMAANRGWIDQLLEGCTGVRGEPHEGGHDYLFGRARLAVDMGSRSGGAGRLCGDSGGVTKAGSPCRRKANPVSGRCRDHGDAFEVDVPRGAPVDWCRVRVLASRHLRPGHLLCLDDIREIELAGEACPVWPRSLDPAPWHPLAVERWRGNSDEDR